MRPNLRLVRELGEGGMGSVWIADHLTLGTQVAVKFLHQQLAGDSDEILERFRLEAQAAAKLDSPHVVQIFDFGLTDDGTPFIVMELMRGESLADRLEREGWVSVDDCIEITRQTARALQAAHDHGFIHRDVKPDNIFLCDQEDGYFVKLLDFGVAKDTGDHVSKRTLPGTMVGTPEYLSREAVTGSAHLDHRADLWSLAVVVYEMLTGDVPFQGNSLAMVSIAILEAEAEPVTELRRGLDPAIDGWFERAFARDADARQQSAREQAQSLEAALRGEARSSLTSVDPDAGRTLLSEGTPELPLPPTPVEKRRFVPLAVAVVAAVVGVVVGTAALAWPDPEPTALRAGLAPSVELPTADDASSEPEPDPVDAPVRAEVERPAAPATPAAEAPPPPTPASSPPPAPAPATPPSPAIRADYGF